MHRILMLWAMIFLLAGCFRDASNQRDNPTSVPLSEFLNTTTATLVPSFTPPPQSQPTKTLPVGGPPVAGETATPIGATLPPTRAIPSFTPGGATFGDSGITPTAALPTPRVPDALITPTNLVQQNDCIHLVQANQTLFSIADQLGVTVDEMIAFNPILASNPNALQIGQELVIPNCQPSNSGTTGAATSAPTTTRSAPAGGTIHVVSEGDTLFRIALQYGTTVDAIVAANPVLGGNANAIINIGQELVIPQP